MLRCPGFAIGIVRKFWRFSPLKGRIAGIAATSEKVQMNASMLRRGLHPARFCSKIQRPIAGFPVVDAAAFELWQGAQHGLSRGGNQKRPLRKFGGREFTALPDFTRRIDQRVPAILATNQSCAWIGQRELSTGASKKCPSQSKNSPCPRLADGRSAALACSSGNSSSAGQRGATRHSERASIFKNRQGNLP